MDSPLEHFQDFLSHIDRDGYERDLVFRILPTLTDEELAQVYDLVSKMIKNSDR